MKVLIIIFLFLSPASMLAQDPLIDSLRNELSLTKADTARVLLMTNLAEIFCFYQIDSAIDYTKKAMTLAKKSNYLYGQFATFVIIYFGYNTVGDYSKALEATFNAYRIAEKLPNRSLESMAKAQMILGFVYRLMGFYQEAIVAQNIAMNLQRASGQPILDLASGIAAMPMSYLGLKRPDSALRLLTS